MPFLVLRAQEIERCLPMAACIEVMAEALAGLSRGELDQPLRTAWRPAHAPGFLVWMPARRGGPRAAFGVKQLCIVPDNPSRGLDAHQGAVLLFDGLTGVLDAVLDASTVTAIRTAAVSAVATRALARPDAAELALVGTGIQAARHLEALRLVRPIRRVRVAGRTPERARAFAARHGPGVVAADSAEEAVRGADIVVLATSAREPVIDRRWLAPGAHVNAVGASQPSSRELDAETMAACALFVDRRQSLEAEAGEWQDGMRRGLFGPEHVRAELGEVLAGLGGRSSPEEITLFRSLGLAAEDLAAAQAACERARAEGVGTVVEW